LAFVIATLINVSIDANQNIAVWFSTQDKERYAAWFGLAFLGIMFFLMRFQHYSDRRPFWDELGDVLRLVSSLALLDMTLVATTRWNSSRLWWLMVWALAVLTIVWGRMLTRFVLQQWGLWIRPTIIIGHGENATEAAIALQSEPRMGFEVQVMSMSTRPSPFSNSMAVILKISKSLKSLRPNPAFNGSLRLSMRKPINESIGFAL
jgi:FlaA1/EpsC-like NDP-sugar epimerase